MDTDELLGDIKEPNVPVLIAQGGFHGLGNTRFKSSVNRSPRQTTQGSLGSQEIYGWNCASWRMSDY